MLRLMKPTRPGAHALGEKSLQGEVHTAQPESSPCSQQLEKVRAQQQRPETYILKKENQEGTVRALRISIRRKQ